MFKSAILGAMLISLSAQAVPHKVTVVDASNFAATKAETLADGVILNTFTSDPQKFENWSVKSAAEKEFLTPFEGYVEPSFPKRKFSEPVQEKLTMFVSKSKAVLNIPSAQINLKAMITPEFAAKLDPQIKHIRVSPEMLMPNVVGKAPVKNFEWCNEGSEDITRPRREVDLSVLNPTDRGGKGWCSNADRAICLESCFRVNAFWKGSLYAINKGIRSESEKKDYGIAIQSELRYFVSEAEMGKKIPLEKLTGVNTKVIGVLEQNMFYFNQVLQYGKVLAVFQEHPTTPGKTIVSSVIAVGIRTRSYEAYSVLRDVLMSRAPYPINTTEGITAGLPIFSQDISKKMADTLDP